jgi:TonB family protein
VLRKRPRRFKHFLVLSLLDDPDMAGRLRDLRVLTVGFLELSARAVAPPSPLAPAPAPEPKAAQPVAAPAPAGPEPGKVYGSDDEGVLPPISIKQDIPLVPAPLLALSRPRGLLEITIDERGRVVSLNIRMSIHPTYDGQLLAAAREWRYQPATFNGQPVKFRKLIQIAVKR